MRRVYRSLCKAAAVVTVVQVLKYIARRFRLLRCILSRVQSMVGYGLSYTICFISIYGLSFSEGAVCEACLTTVYQFLGSFDRWPSISNVSELPMCPTNEASCALVPRTRYSLVFFVVVLLGGAAHGTGKSSRKMAFILARTPYVGFPGRHLSIIVWVFGLGCNI